jgi:desumoylating isopeptidase 1
LKHNCNTFSEELCQFLCGASIPKYILDLPQEFLSTPLGQSLGPLIDSIGASREGVNNFSFEPQVQARAVSPGFDSLNVEIEQARVQSLELEERRRTIKDKIDKKGRKKGEKKKKKSSGKKENSSGSETNSTGMSEVEAATNGVNGTTEPPAIPSEMLPSEIALQEEKNERLEEEERKRKRDPPVVYKEVDPKEELDNLVKLVDDKLNEDEKISLEELHQYLLLGEGSWALGDNFLNFIERILRDPQLSTETRSHLLRVLSNASLKDDIILVLHQDRRDHVLMNYAYDIDRHAPEEQQALALFVSKI